jgi:single-stranded-DNA-specific exonuclease
MSLAIRRREVPAHGPWPDHVPAVLQRVYAARGVHGPADAELRLQALHPPAGIAGLDAGVALLRTALRAQWRVLVVGDFDCDGATACAVAVRGLRMLGAARLLSACRTAWPRLRPVARPGRRTGRAAAGPAGHRRPRHRLPRRRRRRARARAGRCWSPTTTCRATLPAADAIVDPNLADDRFPSKRWPAWA